MMLRALFVALGALTLLAATTPSPAPSPATIRRGVMSVDAVNWPDYVAHAQGFYEREGLTVEDNMVDGRTTITALIGGSLDLAFGDATGFVLAVEKGASLVNVGWGADRIAYRLMAPPQIKTFADLRGKVVAASGPLEVYTTVLRELLKKGGLDPDKDVTFVYSGSQGQRFAALAGGAVQAGLIAIPANLELAAKGFHSLASTTDLYPTLSVSALIARSDWVQAHPDVIRRYLRAQADATAWLYAPANKERAIAVLVAATKSPPDIAAEVYREYIGGHEFPTNACVARAGMQNLIKVMHETGRTALTPAAVDKITDTQFCPR